MTVSQAKVLVATAFSICCILTLSAFISLIAEKPGLFVFLAVLAVVFAGIGFFVLKGEPLTDPDKESKPWFKKTCVRLSKIAGVIVVFVIVVLLIQEYRAKQLREEQIKIEIKQAEEKSKRELLEFEERTKREGRRDVLLSDGWQYFKEEKFYDAIRMFKQVIVLDSACSDAYFGLGGSYLYLKQYTDAISTYNQGLSLEPNNKKALYGLGLTYFSMLMPEKALAPLRKVIEIDPGFAPAHQTLCMTYMILSLDDKTSEKFYYDKAFKEYIVLTRLNPDVAKQLAHYFNR